MMKWNRHAGTGKRKQAWPVTTRQPHATGWFPATVRTPALKPAGYRLRRFQASG
ncbi:hypothetical protein QE394_003256 [Arthrobacter sp. SORGH_AS 212]|nr:hypothetical protein [Arthrobacter sp. SORGH_AS_0212]